LQLRHFEKEVKDKGRKTQKGTYFEEEEDGNFVLHFDSFYRSTFLCLARTGDMDSLPTPKNGRFFLPSLRGMNGYVRDEDPSSFICDVFGMLYEAFHTERLWNMLPQSYREAFFFPQPETSQPLSKINSVGFEPLYAISSLECITSKIVSVYSFFHYFCLKSSGKLFWQ
jgi:hypothetical protein